MIKITLEELLEAGAHLGHEAKKWNPKMAEYIYATQQGIHVFDLTKTKELLEEALIALEQKAKEGGVILFVGTKRQAKDKIKEVAEKVDMPYITTRWLGGTLTNFNQILASIRKLKDMKKAKETAEYINKYTKKERLLKDKDILRLERFVGGIADLSKPPDMLFVVDTAKEKIAVDEAYKMAIPVVGIVDTNADPDKVEYPIPANDDSQKSIELIVNLVAKAVQKGKKKVTNDVN